MTQRHLAIVFRGTGGVIGQDYVSRVCQGVSDLVEEINPKFDATMGGIPVGTANNLGAKSMKKAVDEAVWDATGIIKHALTVNPNRKVIVGGYSAGAVAAARVRKWLQETYPDNYLCSFSFGDPTRPHGGSYYGGPILSGQGISSWRYGDVSDWRHCWLTDPGDMYGNIPLGAAGDILDDFYDMITATQISDPLVTALTFIEQFPKTLAKAGINPLAAFKAADVAIKFATSNPPTAAHIQYEHREVWPGQTYLGLAIQHVRDYASRVPLT
ncbi:lysin B [Mycobacterium phage Aragog]|uniref:Lysin B n=2 Tax=Benedictvirus TaxID=2946819 RepID=A0A5Q2WC64_9CAUD|nr:lysin B [Mycobacterium phage Jovo]YP_010060888.1 lysin B [Mycobacterium phage Bluefalcon]ATW60954.1 lysin B [Mycobacterium phage Aragog]WNM67826.1 lysin B [Mycobacterium phage Discoknowium]AHB31874.1 lysin B [Mycobacterium phage Jovo]QGH75352.1 lysin B [Mycobacterium phage Bluefalcon]